MSIPLCTTFDYEEKSDYFEALTIARPDNSGALWYRLPETLKWSIKDKENDLIKKIKTAINDKNSRKEVIKEVFVELFKSLEIGFDDKQIKEIVDNYDKFTNDFIVPIEFLEDNTYLLNESYGPTDAFKDLALQMVTAMVSIIVKEHNKKSIQKAKKWIKWQKLKFVITQTSTSWDTGPAWWSGIEWKDFVMNVIGFPENEATYSQKWQMMRLKQNVKSISMNTSFSNIQESMLKWNTSEFKSKLKEVIEKEFTDLIEKYGFNIEIDSGSFNSINPWRVDGQTIYHSYWLLQAKAKDIIKDSEEILEVIPSGNGWHMYSVLMARLVTWESWKTIVTCNRNNMFYQIIEKWVFQKPESNTAINEPSVSMIIEYPNNMIRLFSYAFWEKRAKEITDDFFDNKKIVFTKEERNILKNKLWLVWVEISWKQELETIWEVFETTWILVCPHTANAIAWLKEYRKNSWDFDTKALVSVTASPWKFLASIASGLSYKETDDIEALYNKYKTLENTREWAIKLIDIIAKKYKDFWKEFSMDLLPQDLQEIYKDWYDNTKIYSPTDFQDETIKFLKQEVASIFKRSLEKYI